MVDSSAVNRNVVGSIPTLTVSHSLMVKQQFVKLLDFGSNPCD